MPVEARALVSLLLALTVVYVTTPIAGRVAVRFGFYDEPVGYKGHARPTPYLGGTAVVIGFCVALLLAVGQLDRSLPLLGGVGLLCAVGTVDDRHGLGISVRLAAEAGAGLALWALGLGWSLGAGALVDASVTCLWIVGVVNAFNLIDNMDGAASSIAAVAAAGLAALGTIGGDLWLTVAAAALAGACVGFLPHNLLRSPARIFLGDGGSLPIGFAVGALTMMGVADGAPAAQSLAMGVLLVGVPALDTCLVVVSRHRRGVPIVSGGRDHLTHRARAWLGTARAVALALGATQAVVSAVAIVALHRGSAAVLAAVAAYAVAATVLVALLETRPARLVEANQPLVSEGSAAPRRDRGVVLAAGLGVAAGVSPLWSGFYASSAWVPIGLGLVALTAAVAIAEPVRLSRPSAVLLGAVVGLSAWATLSAAWADSVEQALAEGNRYLTYAALLAVLLLTIRGAQRSTWLLGGVTAGGLVVAVVILVRMVAGDTELFLGGRLHLPLGYINGQAAFALLLLWPCVAAAEHRSSAALAGAGAAAATVFGALLVLGQSRGAVLALVVSIGLALLVPGRLRRVGVLTIVAAGVAGALPALLDVFSTGSADRLTADGVSRAGWTALAAAAVTGLVTGVAHRLLSRRSRRLTVRRSWATGTLGAVLATALAVLLTNGGDIRRTLDRQVDAFTQLDVEHPAARSGERSFRLISGSGNRYDYWRVAARAWRDDPLAGVGAGNYDRPYFALRRTTEDVRQPHSLPLQVLAELGAIGMLFLLAAAAAVAWGGMRMARAARAPAQQALAVASIGMVAAWATQTSVDWLHLLPGVTAAALAGVAILGATGTRPLPVGPSASRPRRLLVAASVGALLVASGVSLARQGMAEHYRRNAASALAADPARALTQADRALRLDAEAVEVYHLRAAALARFGDAVGARAALREATRREPEDFVTWALLADVELRAGDVRLARDHYRVASGLNPRDQALRTLAQDPVAAWADQRAGAVR